jgi:hypothetical protein
MHIPGIQKFSALCILSEIGNDMDAFGKASLLVGWAELRPRSATTNRQARYSHAKHCTATNICDKFLLK